MIPAQVRIDPEHVQESLLGHGQEGAVLPHLDLSNSLLVRTYMHNGTRFGRTAQGYGSLFVIYSCVHDVVGILKRLAEMMTH